ncbi:MAG: hypothetical protein A2Y82_02470 [Candidatus Buchananbacteria bacterium RBG_13_36_9]|uniref:Sortilin N-terminal domain-containing protein n=1 Tax=Candidatus Buchananbacteria bacterium RBG_13_36_9 TaxID=1797530 RepID=A0A1G1XP48_9BACT|nr:MAG: hypothetical protein A2Y82_02470 [Candidatus Buchananbacteria bacterium RBG_13_36_9]
MQKVFKIFCLICVIFILVSCVQIKTGPGGGGTPGVLPLGIFKSNDSSVSWQSKALLANVQGKFLAITDVSINQIIMDPSDHNALYLATDQGLFYSYDASESWQQVTIFGSAPINSIAVDYFNKCVVFVTAGQSIYKTDDCLRTWQELYFDKSRPNLQFTVIATEDYNKNFVYAANNLGEILKSTDYGKTWQTIKRFNNPIKQILIDKDDTRIIYFCTESEGILKTTDGGKTWSDEKTETNINKGLDAFYDSKLIHYLTQDLTQKDSFMLASRYGLLKTTDGGKTWQGLELITPERGANIYGVAIDPKDNKIIYYGTDTTLYKSIDGGKNWATQKSPTSGTINILLIDSQDQKLIYLGAKGN